MKTSVLAALSAIIALAATTPTGKQARQGPFEVGITFYSAGPNPPTFFQLFPANDQPQVVGMIYSP